MFDVISTVADPQCKVWLVLEDYSGWNEASRYWLFEGELSAVVEVLGEMHLLEFYIVARDLGWLFCENHHGVVFGVGAPAEVVVRRYRASDS